jgi:nucleoside-triphosphatase
MKQVCLLTGKPGTGKTSLIKQAITAFHGKAGGFYTEEIRNQGARQGFRLVTLDGESAILSHVDIKSPYRVSRYGVSLENLDSIGVAALQKASENCDLFVVDEIGKMELFSPRFYDTVIHLIDSGKRMLGTIMLNPHPLADAIKSKPQIDLITLTRASYQQVLTDITHWLNAPNE